MTFKSDKILQVAVGAAVFFGILFAISPGIAINLGIVYIMIVGAWVAMKVLFNPVGW